MVESARQIDESKRLFRLHRVVGNLGDELHVFAHGEARDQIVKLEHEADMLAAIFGQLCFGGHSQLMIAPSGFSGGGVSSPPRTPPP